MLQKELLTKKDYAAIGEEISHDTAKEFIKAFDREFPTENKFFTMGKNILEQVLSQPGCVGMRFYNGINEKGQKTLVYVGVDAEGKDLIERTVVQEDGGIATVKGLIVDRNNNGDNEDFDIVTWIFGF
jgi:hypothetical protein